MKTLALILVSLLFFNQPAAARLVQPWTKAQMEKAADLIVVGTVAQVRDLDETNSLGWTGCSFRGVETTFNVLHIFKGSVTNGTVVLHHYRFENVIPPNAPSFLELKAGDPTRYLLYLVKDGPSRYAPVSGQIAPALDAVKVYTGTQPLSPEDRKQLESGNQNPPSSMVLPPKDWDIKQHILYPLIVTNKPGTYVLQSVWIGMEKVTASTGWFVKTDKDPYSMNLHTNKVLRFDRLSVCPPGRSWFGLPVDRYIWDTTIGQWPEQTYRPTLPSDSELLAMQDVSAVTNFLGFKAFMNLTNGESIGTCFFTPGPYNSIDTMDVVFFKPGNSSKITAILVRRARCLSH